jgi:hypothetical protein
MSLRETPRNVRKAVKTGPKRKRRVINNSQFINPIGIYENDSYPVLTAFLALGPVGLAIGLSVGRGSYLY